MKKLFISDLKVGDSIFGETFAVKSYVKKASRNNKPYIDIELADRSGTIRSKIWSDDFPNCSNVIEGDVVEVNGTIDEYNGTPQIKITNLKKTEKFDLADLQQKSAFNIDEMWQDLEKLIENTKNPHIKELLKNVFDADFVERFKMSPAAFRVHHAYVGGLLEHTWEMLKMASTLKSHYSKINMDLVYAGVLLHDCGKAEELKISTAVDITDRGKLLGHIYLGTEVVRNAKPKEMPEDLYDEIIHIILSHHGELQYGSPVPPMTSESIAVNVVDMASSRMNIAYGHIHNDLGNEKYTPYVPQLGTELYRSPYMDELTNEDIPF